MSLNIRFMWKYYTLRLWLIRNLLCVLVPGWTKLWAIQVSMQPIYLVSGKLLHVFNNHKFLNVNSISFLVKHLFWLSFRTAFQIYNNIRNNLNAYQIISFIGSWVFDVCTVICDIKHSRIIFVSSCVIIGNTLLAEIPWIKIIWYIY
jgi:hypothetical protein